MQASITCPECGSTLAESAALPCPNPDCPARVRAALARWCATDAMDIAGADEKLIAQLVARGLVLDAADFYRLRPGELLELEVMDEARAEKLLAAIAASRARPWWRVLAGLGLPGVDAARAEELSHSFKNLDDLAQAPRARLLAALDEEAARVVAAWFGDSRNRSLIKRLRKSGVNAE